MQSKKFYIAICLFLCLFVAGCGPSYLSEEEFVEQAKGICQTLTNEFSSLQDLDYAGRAAAYRSAVDALDGLEISEESAPQGFLLRTSLRDLADAKEKFGTALDEAQKNAGMNSVALLMITEGGKVFASETGSIFETTVLEIDAALVLEMNSNLKTVSDTATALGLENCAPEKLEDNE